MKKYKILAVFVILAVAFFLIKLAMKDSLSLDKYRLASINNEASINKISVETIKEKSAQVISQEWGKAWAQNFAEEYITLKANGYTEKEIFEKLNPLCAEIVAKNLKIEVTSVYKGMQEFAQSELANKK